MQLMNTRFSTYVHDCLEQKHAKRLAVLFRRPWLFAGLLVVSQLIIAFSWFTPIYDANDDVGLRMKLSGLLEGTPPTEFVVYFNIIYAKLLVWLYSHFSGVLWY